PSWIEFQTDNTIRVVLGVNSTVLTTTRVFRDPSAWYHLVLSVTASGASYFYVNGIQVGTWTSSATPYLFNSSYTNAIGRYGDSAVSYFDGYLTEINFIDGQALTPSSFGETDAITGRWKAGAYSGTYGTNWFYLKFADNSGTTSTTLGKDSSSNGNNWTPNNFSVTAGAGNDSLVDSPTNYGTDTGLGGEVRGNYATLNPLSLQGASLSNGNLECSTGGVAPSGGAFGNFAIPSTGKWYWEFTPNDGNGFDSFCGISTSPASSTYAVYYAFSGEKYVDTANSSYGSTYGQNDIIGVAVNSDSGSITFYKNNVSQGAISYSLANKTMFPWFADGSSARNTSFVVNFGQRPFAYTAPTGFKALCTQNLNQPSIQKPSKAMDVVAYTGTGASNSVSSLGFSPDLVWIKNRGAATSHAIYDTTRGTQKQLSSDTTGDEVTSSTGLTSFNSNGFTIGTGTLVNTSGTQYVAWAWDKSSQDGLDIISYTGNGANRTISHNLGVAPKMIIVKARTTAGADQGWPVWHASIANTTYLTLSTTSATATGTDYWNSTSPTSSVFSVGTNAAVNANNDTYISYLFAEIEGYSKFGSYTGNNSADGPFIWCGFRPRWMIIKRIDANAKPWCIHDTGRDISNVSNSELEANSSTAENGGTYPGDLDILSNGFKLREAGTGAWINEPGNFIFAAFAESPFKYARAR
ncbi:MAG: hypothetical protein EBZ07_06485, partial [Verrucomicrobia bacterium]|nr:hypothetical protein [Verrucomicrobiota bacterium]